MRFGAVEHAGDLRVVVALDGNELALLPERFGDLFAIVAGGDGARLEIEKVVGGCPRVAAAAVSLRAPLRRQPRDVLCTGWNYWDHFEEGIGRREGQEVGRPDHPVFFTKGPDTIVGPTDDIAFDPRLSAKWDYEAELAVVFGKTGRSIPEQEAMDHVWGYLLANDISQRDLQRAHGGQWLKGKSIDGTMPIGPFVVTADEVDAGDVELECFVNGKRLQHANTSQMAFTIEQLVAELSLGMTVRAGQLFLIGTPSGVGNARQPQVFLQSGDEVVVRGSGLGELRNRMVEMSLTTPSRGATP